MGNRTAIVWARLAKLGLCAQAGWLAALVCTVALALAPLGFWLFGLTGVAAVVAAGAACLAGGEIALAVCKLLQGILDSFQATLLAMMVRMLLPLLLCIGLHFVVPAWTQAGLFFYLLAYYPPILAAETALAVARLKHELPASKG